MRIFRIFFFSSLIILTVNAHSQIIVKVRPLAPREVEIRPEQPGPNYIWIDGFWRVGHDGTYVWTKGHWAKMKTGHVWVKGYWKKVNDGWCWVPGYWDNKRRGEISRG